MSALQVILFGGLELWARGRRRPGFESQKTAALFAYLIRHRGRHFSREHLAALLWPEADEDTARANIRQALYNIRATMPRGRAVDWILTDREGVALARTPEVWVDCEEFEELLSQGDTLHAPTGALLRAAELYRGDLLAGLAIRDSEPFEVWLLSEQERWRQLAIDGLQRLVATYTQRGEYRLGIKYAARLVEMDPFRESGHRALMVLYACAGERNRAMLHYLQLAESLKRELDVAPQPETRDLFVEIASGVAGRGSQEVAAEQRPVVPLVGRRAALAQLEQNWRLVASGRPLVTVVEGEEGVGKSRLIRSFLDSLSSRGPVMVVTARFPSRWPQVPYEPLPGLLAQMLARVPGGQQMAFNRVTPQGQAVLAALSSERSPGSWQAERLGEGRLQIGVGLAELVRWVVGGEGAEMAASPLVVFLDDADHGAPATLRVLGEVMRNVGGLPVWLLVTCTSASPNGPARVFYPCVGDDESRFTRLRVERLSREDVDEIARELVEARDASTLSQALAHASGGSPLAIVTLINTLRDEEVLQPSGGGSRGWRLSSRRALAAMAQLSVPELVVRRLNTLSPSVRRVAALAAVAVEDFDVELLARAEGELPEVIQVGMELLMNRWFIRLTPSQWASGGLAAGTRLWGFGARNLRFDFDHAVIGRAILYSLPLRRRRVLHALLAAAVGQQEASSLGSLAYHHAGAGNWLDAVDAAATIAAQEIALGAHEDAARTIHVVRSWVHLAEGERSNLYDIRDWQRVLARWEAIEKALDG